MTSYEQALHTEVLAWRAAPQAWDLDPEEEPPISWPKRNPGPDPRIIPQEEDDYCGCACALMVLRTLGLTSLPTQRDLYEMAVSGPFSSHLLAVVMNEIWASKDRLRWQDQCFGTKLADLRPIYDQLGHMSRSWIAHLRTAKKMGHLVVVADAASNHIEILDPEPPGFRYWMTPHEFKQVWTGSAVYLVEEVS